MKIKNKNNKTNYVNFKSSGIAKRLAIPAGKTVNVLGITNVSQIINFGDFERGFFEVVSEEIVKVEKFTASKNTAKKTKKTNKKSEDSLDKVEKEVKDYTDNKDNK